MRVRLLKLLGRKVDDQWRYYLLQVADIGELGGSYGQVEPSGKNQISKRTAQAILGYVNLEPLDQTEFMAAVTTTMT